MHLVDYGSRGENSSDNADDLKPEPPVFTPTIAAIFGALAFLLLATSVYCALDRGGYFLIVGIPLAFIAAAFCLSLFLERRCPPFPPGFFASFPICQ